MLAIKNGNLLMSDGKLVKGTVLIEGGVIKSVGERTVVPPKTRVIDASGKTVMPGLIDAHTHLTVYQDPALLSTAGAGKAIMRGAFLARQALRAGITTMRDMGGFMFTDIDLRNAIANLCLPGLSDRGKFVYEAKKKSFKIVLKRGVRWGVGTDSGAFSPMSSIVDELVITHSLGVSVAEALRRVTAVNAELIGLKDIGTLAAGKRADIIVIDGNPLKDLEALRNVMITIANGVVYDWSVVP
jgi:imidazolonepropionase-like amidohydrolase